MTPDLWLRTKDVFAGALEREPAAREAYVAAACGGDDVLQTRVLGLLRAHAVEDGFIERPAADRLGWPPEEAADPDWIGRRIGAYRVVAEAGRGGMSRVFRAVRDGAEYEQQVAIKLLRADLGADTLRERFRTERRILASLSHPNIAHFLDGGTTDDGTPYLVMEFVEGTPIDAYCERHALGLEARLDLFRTLCAAVHSVHQHLMVHGDLKGGNVLVTADGVVKLLDFGIARLLAPADASREATRAATLVLLTPEYASPEQLRGENVTTATDVYSLGALLYRLLAGITPFGGTPATPVVLAQRMASEAPPPSAVARARGGPHARFAAATRGDLDTVVLKALKSEPAERYASAQQLADDVHRFLRGFPVEARPDSRWYRTKKFLRRHAAASVASALGVAALVGGIAVAEWQAHVARTERARAERHSRELRELSTVFLEDVYEAVTKIPGSTAARRLLVDNSLKYLSSLERDAGDSIAFQEELARAYERLGEVQGSLFDSSLGDPGASLRSFRHALEIRRRLAAAHPCVRHWAGLLGGQSALFQTLLEIGRPAEAGAIVAEANRTAERIDSSTDVAAEYRRTVASWRMDLAQFETLSGRYDAALATLERARVAFEALAAASPRDRGALRDRALVYARIGQVHLDGTLQWRTAIENYERSLAQYDALARDDAGDAESRRRARYVRITLGELHNALQAPDAAVRELEPVIPTLREMRAADPADRMAPIVLAVALTHLGESRLLRGEYAEALTLFRESESLVDPAAMRAASELRVVYGASLAGIARAQAALRATRVGVAPASTAQESALRALAELEPVATGTQSSARARRLIAALTPIARSNASAIGNFETSLPR